MPRGPSLPPPPPPPPSPTHSKVELDEQWRADLRKRFERDLLHKVEGAQIVPSASPQLNGDTKRGSDENFDDRYQSGGREDGMGEPNKSGKRTEEDGEGSTNPRQSRPSVPSTQPSHSKPTVSPSCQQQPPNFQPAADNDDEDLDNSTSHPAQLHGSRPYSPSGPLRHQNSSGSLPSVWRPVVRTPEPDISRTLAHATGQISIPSQFARHGSVRSTGPIGRGAGHHHVALPNSDQHRSRLRERQTSASTSPQDRLELGEAVRSPISASPGSQAIPVPRVSTLPGDRSQGPSWSSLNSLRAFGDVNMYRRHRGQVQLPHADSEATNDIVDQHLECQKMNSVPSIRIMRSRQSSEQIDMLSETKDSEAQQFSERDKPLERRVPQTNHFVNIPEAGTQKNEDGPNREKDAKKREAEARTREAEAKKREAEAQTSEAESQKREAEAQTREARAKKREAEAQARVAEAQTRVAEAQARGAHYQAREAETRTREAEAQTREAVAQTREAEVRDNGGRISDKGGRGSDWSDCGPDYGGSSTQSGRIPT
jgi:hypothetical protein